MDRTEQAVSFQDLRHLGYDIQYKEIVKPDGTKIASNVRVFRHSKMLSHKEFLSLLWHLGCNVKEGKYTISKKIPHRCKSRRDVITDYRVTCAERTDLQWARTGHASPEAFSASSRMKDMAQTLKHLSQGG